jgi:hypothetical protein
MRRPLVNASLATTHVPAIVAARAGFAQEVLSVRTKEI